MKYFGAIGRVIPPAGPDLFLLWICYLGAWLSKTRELCCLKPVRVPSSLGSSSKGLPKGCGNLLVMFRKALTYKIFSSIYWYKSGPFLQCRYTPAHVFSALFRVKVFVILCLEPIWRGRRMVRSFFGGKLVKFTPSSCYAYHGRTKQAAHVPRREVP